MSNRKVLIVEDDPDVRLGLHVLLMHHHYDTVFAADGMTATKEARNHQPDLIVLDLGVPVGDGFVLLDRFRVNAAFSVIPIVVVTARDIHGNKERALRAGARAFVQKPWNDDELLGIIDQLLDPPMLSASAN